MSLCIRSIKTVLTSVADPYFFMDTDPTLAKKYGSGSDLGRNYGSRSYLGKNVDPDPTLTKIMDLDPTSAKNMDLDPTKNYGFGSDLPKKYGSDRIRIRNTGFNSERNVTLKYIKHWQIPCIYKATNIDYSRVDKTENTQLNSFD